MELFCELIRLYTKKHSFEGTPLEKIDFKEVVEGECYKVLKEIRKILRNDALDDADCFEMIEKIVCLFEENGVDCGCRHDFG